MEQARKKKATLTPIEQGIWAQCQQVSCHSLAVWNVSTLKTGIAVVGNMVRTQYLCGRHVEKFKDYHEIVEKLEVAPKRGRPFKDKGGEV